LLAYKVLADGRSAFSGTTWPLPAGGRPGGWVSASGSVQPYVSGVHACSVSQLPQWLGDQLYRIELDGEVMRTEAALVALRGRLLAPVRNWDESARMRFSAACAERARRHDRSGGSAEQLMDTIEHLAGRGLAGPVGYWTATLAGESVTGRRNGTDYDAAFAEERSAQARWLASELGLTD
jgi:hypothetical protein